MARVVRRHWPLITAAGLLCLSVAICLIVSMRRNQGHIIYALDDAYIHMAIAKNFARDGVWGVTRYGFSSSSSSLLWTMLLSAVYAVFGANDTAPLALNVISAVSLCLLAHFLLRRHEVRALAALAALAAIVFCTPLPTLVFSGQEHILHTLLTALFVWLSAITLSAERPALVNRFAVLLLAALVVMARYEGLFCVFVVGCLSILRKRWAFGSALAAAGLLPAAAYGAVSAAHGWYVLPNPVLLKGVMPQFSSLGGAVSFLLGYRCLKQVVSSPPILVLLVAALILLSLRLRSRGRFWDSPAAIITVIFVAITCLHMQFARTGWFFRYEAYLVGLGVLAAALAWHDLPAGRFPLWRAKRPVSHHLIIGLAAMLAALAFAPRARSVMDIPLATSNIYQQQYQMGLFVKTFYEGRAVAANDIGAINYLADVRCLDLWGLASMEVAGARRARRYRAAVIDDLSTAQGVSIAIVYDKRFGGHEGETQTARFLPSQWSKAGEWQIQNNIVCGDDVVSFYAVQPAEKDALIANLQAFADQLPEQVRQRGLYTH
jgi:hypothetical protein